MSRRSVDSYVDFVREIQRAGPGARHFPNVQSRSHDNRKVRFYDDLIKGKRMVINFTYAQL